MGAIFATAFVTFLVFACIDQNRYTYVSISNGKITSKQFKASDGFLMSTHTPVQYPGNPSVVGSYQGDRYYINVTVEYEGQYETRSVQVADFEYKEANIGDTYTLPDGVSFRIIKP